MTRPSGQSNGHHYGWVITGTYFLVMASAWGSWGSFGAFVNPLSDDMGWSRGAISGASSTNVLFSLILGAFWGWLSDRWSVRGVIVIGGALMGLGFFLSGSSGTLWQFYLAYGFIAGAGLGATAGPMAAITSRWFDRHRGLALGLGLSGIHAGTAVMPILAQYFTSIGGWKLGFHGLSFIIWGVFLVCVFLLKEPRSRADAAAPPSADDAAPDDAAPDASIPLSQALRTPVFWMLFAMMGLAFLACFMAVVHLVPRAEDIGVAPSTAVTLLTVLGALAAVGTLTGGALGDRIGQHRVFIIALCLMAAALLWLAFSAELWMLYVFAVVFGLGYGGWTPLFAAIAARVFGTRHLGGIYGAILLGGGIGGMIGPLIAGYIFDATDRYFIAFLLGAGLALVAAALALLPPSWAAPRSA